MLPINTLTGLLHHAGQHADAERHARNAAERLLVRIGSANIVVDEDGNARAMEAEVAEEWGADLTRGT